MRAYAAALLVKAYETDPSVFASRPLFNEDTAELNFVNWMQKLLGGKDTNGRAIFTCSAVLSSEMVRFADKQSDFRETMAKIKPPAW